MNVRESRKATARVSFRELPWLSLVSSISLIHRTPPSAAAQHFAELSSPGTEQKG